MKVPETKLPRTRRSGLRAIAWVLLVAFTVQSFVTQTHMHGVFDTSPVRAAAVANASSQKQAPAEDSKAVCPFCQAIVHAGAFSAPPAQILVLPLSWSKIAAIIFFAETFVSVSSHLWKSRAPPRA